MNIGLFLSDHLGLKTVVFLEKLSRFYFSILNRKNRIRIIRKKKLFLKSKIMKTISHLDTKNPQDSSKFKLIMPCLYVLSLISMFFGPFYFPVFNQFMCFLMILIASSKYIMFGLVSLYLLYQNFRVLKRAMSKNTSKRREEA